MIHFTLPTVLDQPGGPPKQANHNRPSTNPDVTNQPCSPENIVFYSAGTGKYHYPRHETPHLLVANFRHTGHYVLNNRPITASDHHFYMLNEGDRLEIDFREELPLQTFLVLFGRSFILDALYFLSAPALQLLEYPLNDHLQEFPIPSVPFSMNAILKQQLYSLIAPAPAAGPTENILLNILTVFYPLLKHTSSRLQNIQAVKRSTREELYQRLFVAQEFMQDNSSEDLTLGRIAAIACLNKFHFLSIFKELHHTTPHQYMIALRLEKAYGILKSRQSTVTETCYAVGFKSQASFSHLFKKKFGIPPSALLK